MTELEFIEKLINDVDLAIKLRKIDMSVYEALDDTEEIENNKHCLRMLGEYLTHFQQIKTKLEAFEILKDRLIDYQGVELQKRWYDAEEDYHYFLVFDKNLELEFVDEHQYEKVKKAMRI